MPLLVATDGAVASLGTDRRRFRPNLLIAGVPGLAERGWEGSELHVGRAVIRMVSLRQRCIMTTFDPDTAEQDVDVLLRIHRELGGVLALDCDVLQPGRVRVGDPGRDPARPGVTAQDAGRAERAARGGCEHCSACPPAAPPSSVAPSCSCCRRWRCGSSSAVMPGQDAGIDLGDQTPIDAPADIAPGGDAAADAGDGLPAFPGAQGWAAGTPGGRGGQIVRVTTLSPGGLGSLAAALLVTGPKIIVFEVGGVIDLMGARYMVQQPFVTIAGQTARRPASPSSAAAC